MSVRPFAFAVFCCAILAPVAAQARWVPARDLDDPGDLVASEFTRANLLNDAIQLGAGCELLGADAPPAAVVAGTGESTGRGTYAARARYGGAAHAIGGAVVAHLTERGTAVAGDLQLGVSSFRPRDLEVITTRDWTFNLQVRAGRSSIAAPPATSSPDSWFVGFGVPFVSSSGENWSFRAFHDLVRWVHDPAGDHGRLNILGGMMYASGDLLSLSFDTGTIEERGTWRVPSQAAAWLNLPYVALGVGGGLAEITQWRTRSVGLAAVVNLP
jgi:hypothetical protein